MPKQDLHDTTEVVGNISSVGESVNINSKGYSSGCFGASGIFSGDVFLEGSIDGIKYFRLTAVTNNGIVHGEGRLSDSLRILFFGCSGLNSIRVIAGSWSNGTAIITITLTTGSPKVV